MSSDGSRPTFPSTHWSLIELARQQDPAARREHLDRLLRHYLPALKAHLMLRCGLDFQGAKDMLQAFVVERVLERNLLAAAEPGKGKFRSFLVKCLQNFAFDRRPKQGQVAPLVEEDVGADSAGDPFEIAWAREALVESLRRMREECRAPEQRRVWELFEARLLRPTLLGVAAPEYEGLARDFECRTPQQVHNLLVTAKRQFRRSLETVLKELSGDDGSVEELLVDLRSILAKGSSLELPAEIWPPAVETLGPGEVAAIVEAPHDSQSANLIGLLDQGDDLTATWTEEDLPSLWRGVLRQPLARLTSLGLADRETTLAELLAASAPSLELLRATKDWARAETRRGGELPVDLATAVYLSCIAAGLVRHGVQISKSPRDVLEHLLSQIRQRGHWLDDSTRELLGLALARL